MKDWFAVRTQPRNELKASEHLARQGFEVLFPRYMKRRSHARKVDFVPAPLFPCYLFIEFDVSDPCWRVVRSTRGVIDLVRNGVSPVRLPTGIIDEIRARQGEDGFVQLNNNLNLARGARIRIDAGPFADYEAIFEAQRDHERVVALLSLLGRKVVVELPMEAITPAD
jgi:transcriptional antiterminator RfaH